MPITTQEDQHISLNDAAAMTLKFRQSNPVGSVIAHLFSRDVIDEILAQFIQSKPVGGVIAHLFTKEIIMEILNQANCEGIRIYHGIDAANMPVLVVSGVDANKNDLYQGTLAEHAEKCPIFCSGQNPLNS